ncbi:hypothetical protein [Caenispirillum bisanense]|uniref:hypothetical protein n=1 Tax=Caenispirillum bisanense TaxID=414052 RepID=UPI0031CF5F6B
MSFEADWKQAKKAFEAATNKKKPSAKFLGFFHKSGVEDAFKAYDKALDKGDKKALDAALVAVGKAASAYHSTLEKAAKAETDALYAKEVKKLGDKLDAIVREAGVAANARAEDLRGADVAAAKTLAEKTLAEVDKVFKAAQGELRTLNRTSDIADARLRAVIEAQGRGDSKTAKAEGKVVQDAVKAAQGSEKKIIAARAKAASVFTAGKAAIAKLEIPKGRHPHQTILDNTDAFVMKLDDLVSEAAGERKSVEDALAAAVAAVKGAQNSEAIYAASCEKLAKRAASMSDYYDAIDREAGGLADRAGQEAMTASETDDPTARAKALKAAENYVRRATEQAGQGLKEVRAVIQEITRTRDGLPPAVLENPKLVAQLKEVNGCLGDLARSEAGFQKTLTKADKVAKSLPALAT